MKTFTQGERAAYAAGIKKAHEDRDMTATERIAKALEEIVNMMKEDRRSNQ